MSAYDLETILKKWKRGDLTTEMAIGQILLQLQLLSKRVGDLEKKVNGYGGERPSSQSAASGK